MFSRSELRVFGLLIESNLTMSLAALGNCDVHFSHSLNNANILINDENNPKSQPYIKIVPTEDHFMTERST